MYNKIKEKFYDIAVRESSDLVEKIKEHPFNVELMNLTITHKSQDGEKATILLIQLSIINRSMI